MFSFGRKKIINGDDESFHEIEKVVQKLEDGNGRVRIVDLEVALQRIDDDIKGGVPPSKHALKFCQFVKATSKGLNITITSPFLTVLW